MTIGKKRRGAAYLLVAIIFAAALALTAFSFPHVSAFAADSQAPAVADSLIVRYDMGDIADGKIKATKWNGSAYVAYPEMDATLKAVDPNGDGVTENSSAAASRATVVIGNQGKGALKFAAGGYAETDKVTLLGNESTGFTVSYWARNLQKDWQGITAITDGTDGARFGNGCMGKVATATGFVLNDINAWPAKVSADTNLLNGGNWGSFKVASDAGSDGMTADTWYQVTISVGREGGDYVMRMYRDGLLKIIFDKCANETDTIQPLLTSLMTAAKNQSGAKLALHSAGYPADLAENEELDDYRLYGKALSQEEVTALYNEYNVYRANVQELRTSDAMYGAESITVGPGVTEYTVKISDSSALPKLLLGGATDVTEASGTYTGVGGAVEYSYTVNNGVYTLTFGGATYTINTENLDIRAGMQDDKLLVHYDMGDIANGKIKATRFNGEAYVPYDEMDAKINGTVTKSTSTESTTAAKFGSKAYASAKLSVPSDATGVTFAMWARNWTVDWSVKS